MVSKATNNNGSYPANVGQSKERGRRTSRKGSRVTQARAKVQRARLDAQAEARHIQEEREAGIPTTPNKKAIRQEMQAKRRVIETLIEAYLQDHMGGNSSEKTLEWHRTALGLMQLFFKRGVGHHSDRGRRGRRFQCLVCAYAHHTCCQWKSAF
jgi:hypothetical protein